MKSNRKIQPQNSKSNIHRNSSISTLKRSESGDSLENASFVSIPTLKKKITKKSPIAFCLHFFNFWSCIVCKY